MSQPEKAFAFRLAMHLGMTVEELGERMTAEEFGLWMAYAELEGWQPGAEAIHTAELLATVYNGPCKPPGNRKAWSLRDFLPRLPWEPKKKPFVPTIDDLRAFEQGLQQARRSTGLLQTAFSARTLGLFGRLPAHALPSYLSGLVIGDELRSQGAALAQEVIVMANAALAQRYAIALKAWGVHSVRTLGSEASWQGLRMVAQALG